MWRMWIVAWAFLFSVSVNLLMWDKIVTVEQSVNNSLNSRSVLHRQHYLTQHDAMQIEVEATSPANIAEPATVRVVEMERTATTATTTRRAPTEATPMVVESNVTIVTAFIDINRTNWFLYGRTVELYETYMVPVLSLRVPMVIYTDDKYVKMIEGHRGEELMKITDIRVVTVHQMPLYLKRQRITEIFQSERENWKEEWEFSMQAHPEGFSEDYIIVMNSKAYLVGVVAAENKYKTEQYCWMDIGYGHGDTGYFLSPTWSPNFPPHKVSLIKLPGYRAMSIEELYRRDTATIAGGFFGGHRGAMVNFAALYGQFMDGLLARGYADDDQTILSAMAFENESVFSLVEASWFDALKIF